MIVATRTFGVKRQKISALFVHHTPHRIARTQRRSIRTVSYRHGMINLIKTRGGCVPLHNGKGFLLACVCLHYV